MRISLLALAIAGGLLAGCTQETGQSNRLGGVSDTARTPSGSQPLVAKGVSSVAAASLPGNAFAALDDSAQVVHRGATTFLPVRVSEAHARAAIAEGEMTMPTPSGVPVRLKYESHVEHDDGNWTWVGNVDGQPDAKAVVTFGPKAVFASIRTPGGQGFNLTTLAGRTYMADVDASKLAPEPNVQDAYAAVEAPVQEAVEAVKRKSLTVPRTSSAQAAIGATTVDLLIGYTNGYVAFMGGDSQAVTRLNHLVDIANTALASSNAQGAIRLVKTQQVTYPDNTSNETALFELTGVTCVGATPGQLRLPNRGVTCSTAARPAALAPLATLREQYGADLVSLVRVFNNPENTSCGTAWLIGGMQTAIDASDAPFAFSVVSDSNGTPDNAVICRDDYLAHELGHLMGQQHDIPTAAGTDDSNSDGNVLDPDEYGRSPYSFGYRASGPQGDFYTVMAQRSSAAQPGYLVFANPSITVCGGNACGEPTTADNVRSLNEMMPAVANFRARRAPIGGNWIRGDFNGDGRGDIVWRNHGTGANTAWLSGNGGTPMGMPTVPNKAWDIQGVGDFDGDRRSDILWRNTITGQQTIWRQGNGSLPMSIATLAPPFQVAGIGDFDGDGRDDIFWRNTQTGGNVLWRRGSSAMGQWLNSAQLEWQPVGVGDFNADGRDDIMWRHTINGANTVWLSANANTQMYVTSLTTSGWSVAAIGDFDNDNRADILWRNLNTSGNTLWLNGNATTQRAVPSLPLVWNVIGLGDFNGDGRDDILWRNSSNGANAIWLVPSGQSQQHISSVALIWTPSG
ncbi:FG-GAP-like repeat-containing protein [Lysobacter sp. A6]|uniref:FG-GAP-like repeat-containing protein n=1 Tax=Noviluteimonas lactosilytica TaxID=2888523 RepID=A0ABS8JGA9_9GAMM|nr:FG-GAP-like repeat-containing protein [Lysobacter lactosilyticus]MCC8362589.1 FG-GAP-like repeat-containing protein [Lysobacter lactosilyticus]